MGAYLVASEVVITIDQIYARSPKKTMLDPFDSVSRLDECPGRSKELNCVSQTLWRVLHGIPHQISRETNASASEAAYSVANARQNAIATYQAAVRVARMAQSVSTLQPSRSRACVLAMCPGWSAASARLQTTNTALPSSLYAY